MMKSSSPLSRLWPHAIIVAVIVGSLTPIAVSMFSADFTNQFGGDFASFYVAGEIVLDGDIERLYEPAVQQARQAEYHSEPGQYLYFAYPPFVAMVYASIAWLPYSVAFAVHSLTALAALAVAVSLIVKAVTPRTDARRATVIGVALALLVYPIATSVLGGQNTTFTLTLLLVALAIVPSISSLQAGVAAGALLYKPQFGLLVVLALVVGRKWREAGWAAVSSVALYLLVVPWFGWLWPGDWFANVSIFGAQNQEVNGSLMVNGIGWWSAVAPDVWWIAVGTVLVVTIPTMALVYHRGLVPSSAGSMSAWLVLAAPSVLFYDAGMALVVFAMFVLLTDRGRWLIFATIGVSWMQLFSSRLGWSPLFLIVLMLWAYQIWCLFGLAGPVSQSVGKLSSPERHDTDA